ncbi:hypothetical protein RSAG8_06900, partial [Rhizoctonia solani AG-8 WAC10335]
MGKLNIAHHKSYHPYRADNIERVRRDEEEARLKEAIEDGRVSLADSEARISVLRERAKAEAKPSKHKQEREEEKLLQSRNPLLAGPSSSDHHVSKEKEEGGALTLTAASGHVNLFEELEYSHQNTLEHNGAKTKAEIDKAREKELERGVPLMPDEKDRRPWYMDKGLKHPKDMTDEEIKLKEQTEPETEREKVGDLNREGRIGMVMGNGRDVATGNGNGIETEGIGIYLEESVTELGAPGMYGIVVDSSVDREFVVFSGCELYGMDSNV